MINIKFDVDSKGAVKNIRAVGDAFEKTSKKTEGWVKAGFLASIGNKALNASLGATKKAIESLLVPMRDAIFEIGVMGDKIAKQARMIGVTAEQFQVMEYAATRSGTSMTAVVNGMKKLGRVMVDAQNGSRQIKDTFDALGITLEKDNGTLRETFDVFLDLADKSMILGESAERTGVQMLLLGRSGTEMSNLFAQGSAGILDLRQELVDLGAIMGKQTLDDAEGLVDKMADMEHAFRGVKIELSTNLLPTFTEFAEELSIWLATTDFTKVRELADHLLDMSIGMARWVDMAGKLELFPKKEVHRLQDAANASEDLLNQIRGGSADYATLTKAVKLFNSEQGESILLAAKQQKIGRMGKYTAHVPEEGPLKKAQDGLLVLREEFQLTSEQIETFNELLRTNEGDAQASAMQLIDLGNATEVQAGLLVLQADAAQKLTEAEGQLREHWQGLIEDGREGNKTLSEREALIKANREALLRSVAQLGAAREAEREKAKADREAARAARELLATRKEMWSWETAQAAKREESLQALYETFYKLDRDQIVESFKAGLLEEHQYTQQMAAAAEQELTAEWSRRNEIIAAALRQGVIQKQEADRLLTQSEQQFQDDRVMMAEEAERSLAGMQADRIASWAEATGAISGMFGAMQSAILAGHGEESQAAQAAAKKMFVLEQGLALAQAVMSMAVAIGKANELGYPQSIPAMVAAGATGAAQVATIAATTLSGIADAGLAPDVLRAAGLNRHTAIAIRNDEMVLDPVGTRHITEMLEAQKAQMVGAPQEQFIRTTVELDGHVLGEAVDKRLIRQAERGLAYTNRIRQGYM